MGSTGLLFLTSAEQPHHQPLPHLCAVVQSDEFSCLLPTSPLHQQIPPLQPPSRAPRLLQSLHQAVPCLIHCSGGVQHSALCFSPCVQRPPKNFQPTAAGLLYMLPASLRLLHAAKGRHGVELGCREALHSAHAAGRKASLPNQMTGPDLATQQVRLSRHGLICHPLQDRTLVLTLQTQEHTEDTHDRTFLCESGFVLEPPVSGCWARPPRQSRGPRCSAAACTPAHSQFQQRALPHRDWKPGGLKSRPREF